MMSTSDANETHQVKKARLDGAKNKVDPTKSIQKNDIWIQILSFVGPGHFIFVAGVNRQMKERYKEYFDAIEKPPKVHVPNRPASSSDTFYGAAFSSVTCASFWKTDIKKDNMGLGAGRVCRVVLRHGNVEVFKWARQQGYKWSSEDRVLITMGQVRMLGDGWHSQELIGLLSGWGKNQNPKAFAKRLSHLRKKGMIDGMMVDQGMIEFVPHETLF